jgi:hypothetical protein
MPDMRSTLKPEIREWTEAELTSQLDRAFDELVDTGRQLSQHGFRVSSGDAFCRADS